MGLCRYSTEKNLLYFKDRRVYFHYSETISCTLNCNCLLKGLKQMFVTDICGNLKKKHTHTYSLLSDPASGKILYLSYVI